MGTKAIVVLLVGLAIASVEPAVAQQVGKVARIGILDPSTASGSAVLWDAFRQELPKFGWVEGKNIAIEYRFAGQKPNRLPELAADLVRSKVDLIVVPDTQSTLAVKNAKYYHTHRDDEPG